MDYNIWVMMNVYIYDLVQVFLFLWSITWQISKANSQLALPTGMRENQAKDISPFHVFNSKPTHLFIHLW